MSDNTNKWLILFIGIIIGIIVAIIINSFLFYSRSFIYTYCNTPPICTNVDYINNPGVALSDGFDINDILFLTNNGDEQIMEYKRPPISNDCIPSSNNQTIAINNPQYCLFTDSSGNNVEAKNTHLGSSIYISGNINVLTSNNCKPITSEGETIVDGIPVLKWDSS